MKIAVTLLSVTLASLGSTPLHAQTPASPGSAQTPATASTAQTPPSPAAEQKPVDNGTDPTRVSRTLQVKFKPLDLRDGFSSNALRFWYTQRLGPGLSAVFPRVNLTTIDIYYVPKMANPRSLVTIDPNVSYNWENEKFLPSLAVTVGRASASRPSAAINSFW